MGLFGFDLVKEAGGWEAAMTEEEITEMEKKGYDMSSVRCKQAEIAAQEEAAEAAFMEQRKATAVPTDLNKLTSYRSTPRSTESEFFKDVAGKAPYKNSGEAVNIQTSNPYSFKLAISCFISG